MLICFCDLGACVQLSELPATLHQTAVCPASATTRPSYLCICHSFIGYEVRWVSSFLQTRIQRPQATLPAPLEFIFANPGAGLDAMRTLILFFLLTTAASAQQLVTQAGQNTPRDAESILIASCRIVGERFAIPMPDPRVELRLGEKVDSVETDMGRHVICLRRWNKSVFSRAAIHVCVQAAETDIVPMLVHKLRDH